MRTCFITGCDEPAHPEADECRRHLREYEADMAEQGIAVAPCRLGHLDCAFVEGGTCSAENYDPA